MRSEYIAHAWLDRTSGSMADAPSDPTSLRRVRDARGRRDCGEIAKSSRTAISTVQRTSSASNARTAARRPSPCPGRRRRTSTRCRTSCRRSHRLFSSVAVMRAPVMPNGWPSAIAPPDTLSLSSSMPSSRAEPSTCTANASLISTRSMSEIFLPALASAFLIASIGPRPMISGDRPDTPGRHDARQRGQAQFLGLGVAHDDHRGGAVVQRTRVARGDRCRSGRNTGLSWLIFS